MFQTVASAVLIGCTLLLSSCAKPAGPLVIKDTLGIGDSLSGILNNKFGLYVNIHSTVASIDDLSSNKLLVLGYTEGHLDWNIVNLGMEKSHKFLFKEVFVIDTIIDLGSTLHDDRRITKTDTMYSDDYREFSRTIITYVNTTKLDKIFDENLDSTDCVFIMLKTNSLHFSNKLKELVIE